MPCDTAQTQADHELISKLVELASVEQKKQRCVNSTTYKVPVGEEVVQVQSWRMREHDYYKPNPPFPTRSRGLFTVTDEKTEKHMVVARGYDKFYNIGEVPWTAWQPLKEHTTPPYVLTLKSNGCIIFIAALSRTQLIVTSKHATGPIPGASVSHSQMGEKWLHRHLEAKGRSPNQLAQTLWDERWTAVAELCDDSFEEHVLPYSEEKTGLHLHGLNENSTRFRTEPSEVVAKFAREWGFIETPYHCVSTIEEIQELTEKVAKEGNWNGEPIEGFVVRCQIKHGYTDDAREAPPYLPGSSFFFKVKFDEPYLIYRDWREITKILLACENGLDYAKVDKSKLRRGESKLYLEWVKGDIMNNPALYKNFNKGKGIIAARERFLSYMRHNEDAVRMAGLIASMEITTIKQFGKTIIMPIAIPGCGKTTVAVALCALFRFGHIQSDDFPGKKSKSVFLKQVKEELKNHDVVIADKNNHLKQHRTDLRETVKGMDPPVRLLAFHWSLDKPPAMIHRICADRITDRGDNHQTLPADPEEKEHEEAIWMFLKRSEPFDDSEANDVVEMDIDDDVEQSLSRAVDACVGILGLEKPSQEEMGKALAAARGYTVTKTKDHERRAKVKETKKEKEKGPRYYGLLPEVDLQQLLHNRLSDAHVPSHLSEMWKKLVKEERITKTPHVTIVHRQNLPQYENIWDACHRINSRQNPPMFTMKLGNVVCDGRVMAITVDGLKPKVGADNSTDDVVIPFTNNLMMELGHILHITVGTSEKSINPYEARSLVERWKNGNGKDVAYMPLGGVEADGMLKGLLG